MEIDYKYLHDALDRVEHTSSVDAFYYQFQAIQRLIAFLHPEIPDSYFSSRFIHGLQVDFQNFLVKFKPVTVLGAYKLASIYEESLYLDYFPESEEVLEESAIVGYTLDVHSVEDPVSSKIFTDLNEALRDEFGDDHNEMAVPDVPVAEIVEKSVEDVESPSFLASVVYGVSTTQRTKPKDISNLVLPEPSKETWDSHPTREMDITQDSVVIEYISDDTTVTTTYMLACISKGSMFLQYILESEEVRVDSSSVQVEDDAVENLEIVLPEQFIFHWEPGPLTSVGAVNYKTIIIYPSPTGHTSSICIVNTEAVLQNTFIFSLRHSYNIKMVHNTEKCVSVSECATTFTSPWWRIRNEALVAVLERLVSSLTVGFDPGIRHLSFSKDIARVALSSEHFYEDYSPKATQIYEVYVAYHVAFLWSIVRTKKLLTSSGTLMDSLWRITCGDGTLVELLLHISWSVNSVAFLWLSDGKIGSFLLLYCSEFNVDNTHFIMHASYSFLTARTAGGYIRSRGVVAVSTANCEFVCLCAKLIIGEGVLVNCLFRIAWNSVPVHCNCIMPFPIPYLSFDPGISFKLPVIRCSNIHQRTEAHDFDVMRTHQPRNIPLSRAVLGQYLQYSATTHNYFSSPQRIFFYDLGTVQRYSMFDSVVECSAPRVVGVGLWSKYWFVLKCLFKKGRKQIQQYNKQSKRDPHKLVLALSNLPDVLADFSVCGWHLNPTVLIVELQVDSIVVIRKLSCTSTPLPEDDKIVTMQIISQHVRVYIFRKLVLAHIGAISQIAKSFLIVWVIAYTIIADPVVYYKQVLQSYKFSNKTSISLVATSSYGQVEEGAMVNLVGGSAVVNQIQKSPVVDSVLEERITDLNLSKVNESISKYRSWMATELISACTGEKLAQSQTADLAICLPLESFKMQDICVVQWRFKGVSAPSLVRYATLMDLLLHIAWTYHIQRFEFSCNCIVQASSGSFVQYCITSTWSIVFFASPRHIIPDAACVLGWASYTLILRRSESISTTSMRYSSWLQSGKCSYTILLTTDEKLGSQLWNIAWSWLICYVTTIKNIWLSDPFPYVLGRIRTTATTGKYPISSNLSGVMFTRPADQTVSLLAVFLCMVCHSPCYLITGSANNPMNGVNYNGHVFSAKVCRLSPSPKPGWQWHIYFTSLVQYLMNLLLVKETLLLSFIWKLCADCHGNAKHSKWKF